jgi:uncharacterized repeat protein (TIGR03803 family)
MSHNTPGAAVQQSIRPTSGKTPARAPIAAGLAGLLACGASGAAMAGVVVLHAFNYSDGQYPESPLLESPAGTFVGTTYAGGAYGYGTIYAVTTGGAYQILHSFAGPEGDSPFEGLALGADGNFYGTTPQGSVSSGGVSSTNGGNVFQLTPQGQFTALYTFAGNGEPGGRQPGNLVAGSDGYFYGTNNYGGASVSAYGTVFRIAPDGTFTLLHAFNPGTDGAYPGESLTLGSDGNFYGALQEGPNSAPAGAIFKMTPAGAVTIVHTFQGTDGGSPSGRLLQLANGDWYGTAASGGAYNGGTVFRMTAKGVITTLHAFNGADGSAPVGGLAVGSDGNFYGLTGSGAANAGGSIFRVSPLGSFMTLHQLSGADGEHPAAGPIFGVDGLLYGTTNEYGGASGASGSVFQFDALTQQPSDLELVKFCYNEIGECLSPINTVVGQSYTVQWTSSNLSSCTASGAWQGKKATAGSISVDPTKAGVYTYNLACTGPGGAQSGKVTVTVGQ